MFELLVELVISLNEFEIGDWEHADWSLVPFKALVRISAGLDWPGICEMVTSLVMRKNSLTSWILFLNLFGYKIAPWVETVFNRGITCEGLDIQVVNLRAYLGY